MRTGISPFYILKMFYCDIFAWQTVWPTVGYSRFTSIVIIPYRYMYRSFIFQHILCRCLQVDPRPHSFHLVPPSHPPPPSPFTPHPLPIRDLNLLSSYIRILDYFYSLRKKKWIFDHILPFSPRHFSFQYNLRTVHHDIIPTVDHNLSSCFLPTYSNNRQSLFTNGRSNLSCLLFFSKNSV